MTAPTSGTTVWNIERRWLVGDPKEQTTVNTFALAARQAVALLGAAGMGKSWEINRLIEHEKSLGHVVRAAEIGRKSASLGLERCLQALASELTAGASIFLDGLDEAMVANPNAVGIVTEWISESTTKGCRIRISCRSALWPKVLHESIQKYCDPEPMIAAELQKLRMDDVRQVLECENLDPDVGLEQIYRSRVSTLAQQPLTLKLLIRELRAGSFSSNRSGLFKNAIYRMCIESQERDELGTGARAKRDPNELIDAAEKLAIFVVTTGREFIGFGPDIAASDQLISLNELAQLPAASGQEFDVPLLRALADTGMFVGGLESGHMQFCERNIAEFLAGRRLARLPVFQSRSILAKDSGWKTGVAGPLRETAAFAASENRELARWVAETDPEVIGLSEVASNELRKIAFQHTASLFRQHKLTDSQVARGSVWLNGLLYEGAIEALRSILAERGDGVEDVHAFAIAMCETCCLQELIPELGNLIRDPAVSFMTRKDAGYVMSGLNSEAAAVELASFLRPGNDFESQEMLGFALRANWPKHLTTKSMLKLLSDPINPFHGGAYLGFLHHLEIEQFDAADDRVSGLTWAIEVLDFGEDSRLLSLAERIAISSFPDHGNDEVLALFLDFVLKANSLHLNVFNSQFSQHAAEIENLRNALLENREQRHRTLMGLIARVLGRIELRNVFDTIPGLKQLDDFGWLLDQSRKLATGVEAEAYAQLAYALDWYGSKECLSIWWDLIDCEPVRKSFLPIPQVDLASELAENMRAEHADLQKFRQRAAVKPAVVSPPPEVRIAEATSAASENPLYFPNVVRQLTLKSDSIRYGMTRQVLDTPGWQNANDSLKNEVVKLAKDYLLHAKPVASASTRQSLNSFYQGPLAALLLVLQRDRAWLLDQADDWWKSWSWQILRELKFNLHGEPNEPKQDLLGMLNSKLPDVLASQLVAMGKRKDGAHDFGAILDKLVSEKNSQLPGMLLEGVQRKEFSGDALSHACKYLLTLSSDFVAPLAAQMSYSSPNRALTPTARIACALLQYRLEESWDSVSSLLEKRPMIARHVLGQYAYELSRMRSQAKELPSDLAGRLLRMLFLSFPPEDDPAHEGAHYVDQTDAAVSLRTRLLNHLTSLDEEPAREAIRQLEAEFGQKYRWLRRARAHAEELYLLNRWQPIPLKSVATILDAGEKRLLRSGEDCIDAIMYALEEYDRQLRVPPTSTLNALWNDGVTKDKKLVEVPYPKQEEHVSDEILKAVQTVFNGFAVTASREVQIFRRRVGGDAGKKGSFTDVFVEVPAAGAFSNTRIVVIVEVKRSCNPDAKVALQTQLIDRYLAECQTDFGIYVVAFFDSPSFKMRAADKPKWPNIQDARADLESQAKTASVDGRLIKSFVLDVRIQ